MSRSKQNKTQKKDGNHRAETKEERIERLRKQAEAREACFKLLPYAGGIILVFLLMFGLYVRSIPPKAPKPPKAATGGGVSTAEFHRVMQAGIKKDEAAKKEEDPAPPSPAPEEDAKAEEATETEPSEEHVEL